jgi:hypothetical protein
MVSEVSVQGLTALLFLAVLRQAEEYHGRRAWRDKVAHLMTSRKQGGEEDEGTADKV